MDGCNDTASFLSVFKQGLCTIDEKNVEVVLKATAKNWGFILGKKELCFIFFCCTKAVHEHYEHL